MYIMPHVPHSSQIRGIPKCCPLGIFTPLHVNNPRPGKDMKSPPGPKNHYPSDFGSFRPLRQTQLDNLATPKDPIPIEEYRTSFGFRLPAKQSAETEPPNITTVNTNILSSSATFNTYKYTDTPPPPTTGTYRADFSNRGLCFFRGIISCPAPHEIHHLTNQGNLTGTLPNGKQIITTLRSIANLPLNSSTITDSLPYPTHETKHIKYTHAPAFHNRDLIHADDGSAASIIREDIAIQLGTPIYTLSNPVNVIDINSGQQAHNRVCYLQLEVPHLPHFRAVILCIVKKSASMPFLLGSDDQATYHIAPQSDDRTVRIGPSSQPTGSIPYLPQEVWSQQLKKPPSALIDTAAELKRKAELSKILNKNTIEPIINILTHFGKHASKKLPTTHNPATHMAKEEIIEARRKLPPAEGPRSKEVHSHLHQQQLLQTPEITKLLTHERNHDQWRQTETSQALLASKTDSRYTDKAVADLTQQALQEGIRIFTGHTISSNPHIPPNKQTIDSLQTMLENIRDLNLTPIIEIDPRVEPDAELRQKPATMPNNPTYYEPPPAYYEPSPNLDVPTPAPTGNFMADSIFAFLASVSPHMNTKADEAAQEQASYHIPPEPISINNEPINNEPLQTEQTPTPSDHETLAPNAYPRDWIPVYQTHNAKTKTNSKQPINISSAPIKSTRAPTKPTPEPTPTENQPTIDEKDFLTKNFIPLPRIAELNEILYNAPKLRQLQEQEQLIATNDPQRILELTAELEDIKATLCTGTSTALKPSDFPADLWSYVLDSQRPLVAARFALFPTDVRTDLIKELMEKLDIGTKFGVELEHFMRAQALANLDTYGYPDPFSPPTNTA